MKKWRLHQWTKCLRSLNYNWSLVSCGHTLDCEKCRNVSLGLCTCNSVCPPLQSFMCVPSPARVRPCKKAHAGQDSHTSSEMTPPLINHCLVESPDFPGEQTFRKGGDSNMDAGCRLHCDQSG